MGRLALFAGQSGDYDPLIPTPGGPSYSQDEKEMPSGGLVSYHQIGLGRVRWGTSIGIARSDREDGL